MPRTVAISLGRTANRDEDAIGIAFINEAMAIAVALGESGDIACAHFLDLIALICMHLQQATNAFLLALYRIVDGVA